MDIGINSSAAVNNYKDEELMEPWAYMLAAAILLLIGFVGFTLNLIVIIIMCRNMGLWTPMNIILFNLVCSDLSVSVMGNPITLTAAISHGWIFGRALCICYGFFMALLVYLDFKPIKFNFTWKNFHQYISNCDEIEIGIASITTLTVLAYERYSLITYPLSSHQLTIRGALIAVLLIWIYSFSLTAPPLFGWGAYVNEAANISCSVNWESRTFNATSYVVFLFFFGLVVPVIIIVYSYLRIALTIRQNSARLGRKSRAEQRVTIMIAVMITAFLVAWTPYSIFALLSQFGPENLITPAMGVMPALIAKSSICYNPLIYVGLNTQFRSSLKKPETVESTAVETSIIQNENILKSSGTIECTFKKTKTFFKTKLKSEETSDYYQKCTFGKEILESSSSKIENDKSARPKTENIDIDTEMTVFADGKKILLKNTDISNP